MLLDIRPDKLDSMFLISHFRLTQWLMNMWAGNDNSFIHYSLLHYMGVASGKYLYHMSKINNELKLRHSSNMKAIMSIEAGCES